MREQQLTTDEVARAMLAFLRSAGHVPAERRTAYAGAAIEALGRLHARTPDGKLPEVVDGRDFRAEAAQMFHDHRDDVQFGAAWLVAVIDDARSDELYVALERRSALQFLVDDFRGTVAGGLIEDDLFGDGEDEYLAEKLRRYGPFDFTPPPHVPATHWWWARASSASPSHPDPRG